MLIRKGIIYDTPMDRDKFPTYDPSEPHKCTPRELTLKLIRQHEFLLNRLVAQTDIAQVMMLKRDQS